MGKLSDDKSFKKDIEIIHHQQQIQHYERMIEDVRGMIIQRKLKIQVLEGKQREATDDA